MTKQVFRVSRKQLQIFYAAIKHIKILVMYHLVSNKVPSQRSFHHKSMDKNKSAIFLGGWIFALVKPNRTNWDSGPFANIALLITGKKRWMSFSQWCEWLQLPVTPTQIMCIAKTSCQMFSVATGNLASRNPAESFANWAWLEKMHIAARTRNYDGLLAVVYAAPMALSFSPVGHVVIPAQPKRARRLLTVFTNSHTTSVPQTRSM